MPRGLRDDDADDHEELGLSAHGHGEEDDDVGATENPTIGILHVNLRRKVAARRRRGLFFLWRSRRVESDPSGPRLSMLTSATNAAGTANPKTTAAWKDQIKSILISASLLDAVATIVLVPLRVGFWFDPFNDPLSRVMWTRGLTVFTIIDFLERNAARDGRQAPRSRLVSCVKSFRIMTFRQPSKIFPAGASARETAVTGSRDEVTLTQTLPLASEDEQNRVADTYFSTRNLVLVAIGCLPLELVSVLAREYNLTHVCGIVRFFLALYELPALFSRAILTPLHRTSFVRSLSFVTTALGAHLFRIGLYLCHLSACGYMFIAYWECGVAFDRCSKDPVPGCWVLKDDLKRGSPWRQYIRTMYLASKTVTTLSQSDLVLATQMETNYCIVVQYISGLWATAFLSACGFYFTRRDTHMRNCISTHLEQALKFIGSRKLPEQVALRVRFYYQHMQRTRKGIEEDLILADLPTRYRTQCSHHTKYKLLKRLPFFRNHQGGFLDFFAPNQTVVGLYAKEEMFILSNGQIRVCDEHGAVIRGLLEGTAFGKRALFRAVCSESHLIADTSCGLWWLPRRTFETTVTNHFSKAKLALIRMQQNSSRPSAAPDVVESRIASRVDGRKASTHDVALRKLMDKLNKDAENSIKSVASWQLLRSAFRTRWRRARFVLLLFIGIAVPYRISFHRGFALFHTDKWARNASLKETTILMVVNFFVNVVVEVFFYVDWYFTAACFVRFVYDGDQSNSSSSNDRQKQLQVHELIVEKKQIFRHYTGNDGYWWDIIANIPFTIVWDALPKTSFPTEIVRWVQSVQVLRLVRLRLLFTDMPGAMTKLTMSRSSQLLVYVSVFCLLLAHYVGCLYHLVADMDGHVDGLPVNNTGMLLIASECLVDASMFGNCTWYMYDYSTYEISSPFIGSMHWSVVLLSTVGYGNILSFSDNECFVGFCALSQWGVLNSIKGDRLQEINQTLVSMHALSPLTASTIHRYYVLKWRMNGSCTTEDELLGHLPKSLESEVTRSLYEEEFRQCAVFKTCIDCSALFHEVARFVRCEKILNGMVLMEAGILATEMFVIQSGAVELVNEENLRFALYTLRFTLCAVGVEVEYLRENRAPILLDWSAWSEAE